MALSPVVDSLDKVPEAARGFYEQKGSQFVLVLDGAPAGFVPASELAAANGKVVQFRDTNIALLQEVEPLRKLKTDLGDADPKAAKDALAASAALKAKGVTGADDVATLITQAVEAALKPRDAEIAALKTTNADEKKRADDAVFKTSVIERFSKAGGKAKAADYIVEQAKQSFKVDGGAVVALPSKFSSDKPGEALGLDEWLVQASRDHDFAFEPSTGGGADPKRSPSGGGAKAGQTILQDPTPAQLGEHSAAIAKGTVKVQYSK